MIKKKVTETNDDGSTHSFYIDENGDIDHAEIVCEMTPQQVHKYLSDEVGQWEFPIEARGIKYQRRPNFELRNKIEEAKKNRYLMKKITFKPPYRVGRSSGTVVLDANSFEVVNFRDEEKAQEYCDFLNAKELNTDKLKCTCLPQNYNIIERLINRCWYCWRKLNKK